MEVKERIIDLRQFFIYLWENAIIIIIVAGLCCGGLMGFSYKKQKDEIASVTAANKAVINTIITQNHDAFYGLSSDNKKIYSDAVPPAGTFNSAARLYVDFNFSNIEGGESLDLSKVLYNYQQDAMLLLVSDEALQSVIDKLNLHGYDDLTDITPDNLKWMINRNFLGSNVMQIVVSDVNPDRAKLIGDAVVEEFISRSGSFASIDKVEIIDNASTPKGSMQSTISIDNKKLVKFGIVGFMGGIIIMVVIYLLLFIFNDSIRTSLDLKFADQELIGTISNKSSKKSESYKRLAYNIALTDSYKVFTFVPTDKKSEDGDLLSGLEEELKKIGKKVKTIDGDDALAENIKTSISSSRDKNDIVLASVRNIDDYADATVAAVNSDAVVIMTTYGKTKMRKLIFAKNELEKTGTNIVGSVITKAKHV